MKCLQCIICGSEVDIIHSNHSINKKVKCPKCGILGHSDPPDKIEPEVLIIRRASKFPQ